MSLTVYVVLYLSAAVFAAACAVRAWRYARTPIHLRWELYPVPHEAPELAEHGGSFFEELDWWTRPHKRNLAGELLAMSTEILLLRALYEHNRRLWYRSYAFHAGLYLLIGACGLILLTALLAVFAPAALASGLGGVLHWLYLVAGAAGVALSIVGALGLLHQRLTDPRLRTSTVPGDIFNLCFFVVAFGLLAAGYLLKGPGAPGVAAVAVGLLTFDRTLAVPPLWGAGLVLCGLLAAYIPLTHMAHFIGKYFTYHYVRWDDAPTAFNKRIALRLAEYLTYRPTWSAAHVGADGKRTWADVATTNPWEGGKR